MRWLELLPFVVIALIFFGPKRLPELGSSVGKTIRDFQKSMREVTGGIEDAMKEPEKPAAPALPPAAPQDAAAHAQDTAAATVAPNDVAAAAEPVSASAAQPEAES